LADALQSLEQSIALAISMRKIEAADSVLLKVIRSGVIQNYETSYELSLKFIQRGKIGEFCD
jgi:hypothetical protein